MIVRDSVPWGDLSDLVFNSGTDRPDLDWAWGLVEADLGRTSHIGEPDVDICFQYYGSYGADVYPDMVSIEEDSAEWEDWS